MPAFVLLQEAQNGVSRAEVTETVRRNKATWLFFLRQRGLPAENAAGDKGAIGRLIPSRRETLDDRAYRAVAGVSSKQQTADKNGVDGWEESVAL